MPKFDKIDLLDPDLVFAQLLRIFVCRFQFVDQVGNLLLSLFMIIPHIK
jgi:hypothetical protein